MFVSNGALVKSPIMPGSSSWFPNSMPGMSSPLWSWSPAYSQMFRSQPWVYIVIMKRARSLARLPLPVYRRGSDSGRDRIPDHPMAKLLADPNPAMSAFKMLEWTSATRDIFGRATWYKERRGGEVVALWPLHPASLRKDPETGLWGFDNGSLILESIPHADLIHFLSFDPDRIGSGMSPLEPLRSTLENEFSARAATSSFWRRGARPGMVLEAPGAMSDTAYARLQASMAGNHEGAGNTGSTMILEEGVKAAKVELTAEEAQYIETRKLNREEVCGVFDIPPPVVHILDRATFANITEQMRSMYRDTMAPIAAEFEGVVRTELQMVEWPQDPIYAEFLMDDVMRGDFETRQDALNKASHMTIAEKRAVENLPFIPGTDRIFLNTATMPLDAIDAQADAIVASTQERQRQLAAAESTPPEPRGLSRATLRAVLGRLGWQKQLDQVDAVALCKGFDADTTATIHRALVGAVDIPGLKAALKEES